VPEVAGRQRRDGRGWERIYADVPDFLAKGFELARSKEQFFLSRIYNRYKSEEVERESFSG